MSKVDKKRKKLQERINYLQDELTQSLTKKSSTTIEINVGEQQRKIAQAQKQLSELK
jgi:hypothetical protein